MQDIEQNFTHYPLYPIYLQQTDVRGTDALSELVSSALVSPASQ